MVRGTVFVVIAAFALAIVSASEQAVEQLPENDDKPLSTQYQELYDELLQENYYQEDDDQGPVYEDQGPIYDDDREYGHYQYEKVPEVHTQVHWHYQRRWVPSKVHRVVHYQWVPNPVPPPPPAPMDDGCFYHGVGADNWAQFYGNLKQIAASGELLWGVDHVDHIFYKHCLQGRWTQVAGKLKHISASGVNIWGVKQNGTPVRRTMMAEDSWSPINATNTPKDGKMVAVSGSSIFLLTDHRNIWYRSDGTDLEDWQQVPGNVDVLAANRMAGVTQLWGIQQKYGKIFRSDLAHDSPTSTTGWVPVAGKLEQISASGDQVWGLYKGDPFYLDQGGSWVKQAGHSFKSVAVDSDHVFAVTDTDNLFFRMGTDWTPTRGSEHSVMGGSRVSSTSGAIIKN